jgi:hypothetical protein
MGKLSKKKRYYSTIFINTGLNFIEIFFNLLYNIRDNMRARAGGRHGKLI